MARNRRASEPLQKTKKRIGGTSLTQGVKGGKTSATFAEDNTSVSDTIRTRESRHVLNSGPSSFDLGAPAMGEGEGQPALPVRGVPVPEPEAAQRRRPRGPQGRIERVNREVIEGWVWDPQASNEPIRLELLNGEERLNVVVANEDRPYLVQLGCGDGRHGFTLRLDEALPSDGRHALTLRCADTGAVMPGSPIIVGHERTATADRSVTINQPRRDLCGYIDEISKDGVIGWVMMPDRPMHRCIVALKENGRIIARATASQFRLDVLLCGFGDGCYAFRLPLPPSLLDGQQHMLEIVEEETGITVTNELIRWNCEAGLDGLPARSSFRQSIGGDPAFLEVESRNRHVSVMDTDGSSLPSKARGSQPHLGTHLLFDVSDLVYYVGHHDNLTGIQRVQSSIILGLVDSGRLSSGFVNFISFNTATDNWNLIPAGYLISLLRDLFLPASQRSVNFAAEPARYGVLPGAQPFDGSGILDRGHPSVLCLLGAAWVQRDYCRRVVMLKRRFGTRFVMAVHDLIPIYARETCDQGTARVFEDFMRRALRHVDHVLAVSENTANDLRRYVNSLRLPEPLITVTKNGSSFAEFLPRGEQPGQLTLLNLPERFVLFVSTIEGRRESPIRRRNMAQDDR